MLSRFLLTFDIEEFYENVSINFNFIQNRKKNDGKFT